SAGLLVIDSTGKGFADLLAWSSSGVALYLKGTVPVPAAGLGEFKGVSNAAQGDFDNDGLPDLAILTPQGARILRNTGGRFVAVDAALPRRSFDRAVWVDYDHDYDLDLMLLGSEPALLRNQGTAGFTDQTGGFPFVKARATSAYKLR